MDIFRFLNPTNDTLLEQGKLINGITDKMWVERYRDPGEFSIKAPISSNVRDDLPIGSLISHTDSSDVMIVENHEISEDKGVVPDVVITGRSFESILEQRVVGSNKPFPADMTDYVLAANFTWDQLWLLIQGHIYLPALLDPNDAILHLMTTPYKVPTTGVSEQRIVKQGQLLEAVLEIMDVDELGLRIIRPGPDSPLGPASPDMCLAIHKGEDKSNDVIFSYDAGDIENADYLWSIKSSKTAIMVQSRWLQTVIKGPETNYDRRMMTYDVSFLDNDLSAPPGEPDRTYILNAMNSLGNAALARRKVLALSKAEVSRNTRHYTYRKDYQVGDVVTVAGDYNEAEQMRVIEYVEIEDKTGKSGYPTLAAI